jgi:intracellular septation protein
MSADTPEAANTPNPPAHNSLKLALDLGPVAIFFVAYFAGGIYWATALIMAATLISTVLARILLGAMTPTRIATTVLVLAFGGLTLWLNDPRFIKTKPTAINLLFAAVLFGGVLMGKPLLRYLLGEVLKMTDAGWRQLSIRYAIFFCVLAALNEIVWRNFSEALWVNFKFFGSPVLTIAFFAAQHGLLRRHRLPDGQSTEV